VCFVKHRPKKICRIRAEVRLSSTTSHRPGTRALLDAERSRLAAGWPRTPIVHFDASWARRMSTSTTGKCCGTLFHHEEDMSLPAAEETLSAQLMF
jgi:hypothetical protein